MATPTRRPGAPAGRPNTAAASGGMTVEDMHALPDTVEGANIDLNPEEASIGRIQNEEVTILGAEFRKFTYPNRDDLAPNVSLFLSFEREGVERPYEERYFYADWRFFAPSPDGSHCGRRDKDSKMNPKKTSPGVQFLQSAVDSGIVTLDELNEQGVPALVGHTVGVSSRVLNDREGAKPVILIDYNAADGGSDPKARRQSAAVSQTVTAPAVAPSTEDTVAAAPEVAAPADNLTGVTRLAHDALIDLLTSADGNKLLTSQLSALLIRHPVWKEHPERTPILQELRKPSFLTMDSAPWVVDGKTVSLSS